VFRGKDQVWGAKYGIWRHGFSRVGQKDLLQPWLMDTWAGKKILRSADYRSIVMGIVENHSDTFFTHSCIKARKEHSGIETY